MTPLDNACHIAFTAFLPGIAALAGKTHDALWEALAPHLPATVQRDITPLVADNTLQNLIADAAQIAAGTAKTSANATKLRPLFASILTKNNPRATANSTTRARHSTRTASSPATTTPAPTSGKPSSPDYNKSPRRTATTGRSGSTTSTPSGKTSPTPSLPRTAPTSPFTTTAKPPPRLPPRCGCAAPLQKTAKKSC